MSAQVTTYQCPSCTGPLRFSGTTGKLECDYCGSSFTVAEIEALYKDKNDAASANFSSPKTDATDEWGEDGEHMRVYNCPQCGAQMICDDTTASFSCPYCNNPTVVPGNFAGILKPEYIIPFSVTKEQAKDKLREFYKGKKLLPREFTKNNHIEEIKGVYVPFWLFDGTASADVVFDATRVHVTETHDERITTTDHFYVRRAGHMEFYRVPADGSSKMPDAYMDAVEPFNYSALKPFSTAYFPGFLADRFDVSAEECSKRAFSRAENSAVQTMKNDPVGYTTIIPVSTHTNVSNPKKTYALLPVWMLTTKWNNKNYLFAVNGQTGKPVGNLPVSAAKTLMWFSGITVSVAAVLSVLYMLFM